MPEHLRALAWILAIALPMFALVKGPMTAHFVAPADFVRRRNLWFAITLVAFVAQNFWVYIFVTAVALAWTFKAEWNPLASFFFLMAAVPPFQQEISGFGLINYLFEIDHLRLMALVVLLPAFFRIQGNPSAARWGSSKADWCLIGYLGLQFALQLQNDTLTNTLRHGMFYPFVEAFLPYYVASRSLTSVRAIRDALASLVTTALVLAPLSVFEYKKTWLLYQLLPEAMGVDWAMAYSYLTRGDSLRAVGPFGHSIAFGYFFAVAIGLTIYLARNLPTRMQVTAIALLGAGLATTFARGSWVGSVVAAVVAIGLQRGGAQKVAKLAAVGAVVVAASAFTPFGAKILSQLPFIGTVGDDSVDYRARLFQVSLMVIQQNPLLGSVDFMSNPIMEQMRQGEGIIDLVNVYVATVLSSGLVGLTLFVSVFVAALAGCWRAVLRTRSHSVEFEALGCAIVGTLLGALVMIATASSILIIPIIYWALAGIAVAFTQIADRHLASHPQRPAQASVPQRRPSRVMAGSDR